jgi:cellulose synthase/poly-beta-1,6-N-acetylglucosamine synthase-like glycosyltransferase
MWARYFAMRPAAAASTPVPSSFSVRVRQVHRWLAILFTLTVIANFATMTRGQPPAWIVYSPLPPLFLLMFSGLYMFALPHLTRPRRA